MGINRKRYICYFQPRFYNSLETSIKSLYPGAVSHAWFYDNIHSEKIEDIICFLHNNGDLIAKGHLDIHESGFANMDKYWTIKEIKRTGNQINFFPFM